MMENVSYLAQNNALASGPKYYTVSQKTSHYTFANYFAKCWPILKILYTQT